MSLPAQPDPVQPVTGAGPAPCPYTLNVSPDVIRAVVNAKGGDGWAITEGRYFLFADLERSRDS